MSKDQDTKDAGGRPAEENTPDGLTQSGSPGPTPGSAEGDRKTVEQDLENTDRAGQG